MRPAAILVMLAGALALSGCLNWQAGYDNAARHECFSEPDDATRRACLDRAEANARQQRAEQRGERSATASN